MCGGGLRMGTAGEAVDEVIGRPGAGDLHLALPHHGAGGGELVLVALDVLAVDQMGDVEDHLSAFSEAAAYLFVEGKEEAVHLEADGACSCLAFPGAGCVLTQVGKIAPAHALGRELPLDFLATTIIDKNLQVHLGLAAQFLDVAEELALVGADGLAKAFVVGENGSEAEG